MIPLFRKHPRPIIEQDRKWEGPICSVTSGLLHEKGKWRLWYSNGNIGADQAGAMKVLYAESGDGLDWQKPALSQSAVSNSNIVLPHDKPEYRAYLPSVHREKDHLVAFIWCDKGGMNGLFRFVSRDGEYFEPQPDRPLFAPHWANSKSNQMAGNGRVSNDAFSILQNEDGSYTYFSAYLKPNTDKRTQFAGDNLKHQLRVICRADSRDGVEWTSTKVILEPEYPADSFETQFYGMHVFRYNGLYLGLLHVYFLEKQIIQPEWVWSKDGWKWHRTRQPCIKLGNSGSFDSRMILFGDTEIVGDELVWIYNGANWKHNDFARDDVRSCVGYAQLSLTELDSWLAAFQ